MNNKIVLVGGGGHCKSVLDTLLRNSEYNEIVITDNEIPVGTQIFGCEVVGKDDILPELIRKGFTKAFITVGSIKSTYIRRKLYDMALKHGFAMVNIIDCSAIVSDHCKLGKGIFIGKYAIINADASIGDGAIINTGAIIEHECKIGDYSHISVGAKLCGNVSIGNDTFIGAGSTVIQNISINDNVIIGAGSTVLRNVNKNEIIYGIAKNNSGGVKPLNKYRKPLYSLLCVKEAA